MAVGQGRGGVAEGTVAGQPAGVTTGVRESKTASQVVGLAHGKYYEAASRGNLYAAATQSSVAVSTALSVTCPFTLYNPLASGKWLAIKRATFAQGATGTFGTGGLFHCVYTIKGPVASQSGTAPVVGGGAVVTPVNCLIGTANSAVGLVFQAGTLNAAPVALYPMVNMSEVAAGTIGDNSIVNFEDVNGAIVLQPGAGWALEGISAAGSSPLAFFGVVWEEINPT